MKEAFISTFRLLAQLAREPRSTDLRAAVEHRYELRDAIDERFNKVRSLSDGVLFEFGPSRVRDMAMRNRIRRWQPRLRTLFVMRVASLKYRLQLPGFELPDQVKIWHRDYDLYAAGPLNDMADWLEGKPTQLRREEKGPLNILKDSLRVYRVPLPPEMFGQYTQSFVTLMEKIDTLTASLVEEVGEDFVQGGNQLSPSAQYERPCEKAVASEDSFMIAATTARTIARNAPMEPHNRLLSYHSRDDSAVTGFDAQNHV